ncbi:MAG: glycosyltransferase family 2 protein [Candidatus Limnocylindrales bacterium]
MSTSPMATMAMNTVRKTATSLLPWPVPRVAIARLWRIATAARTDATRPGTLATMTLAQRPRVVVVMPAYNAARTLERTYADIPHDLVDQIILVDDVSRDETVDIARSLGLDVIIHRQNLGYGGNQKTCYEAALAQGADVVVMLHPDYQYDATRIPQLIAPILAGEKHMMLGSRFLGDPLAGGMPQWKFVANRFLTIVENVAFGLHLSEYHTGLRAYSRRLLETIPYGLNSNDFVFDQELIAQVVAAGMGRRIGEIGVPTRYFEEASSVGFRRSVVYGTSTLRVVARYLLHRLGVRRSPKLTARGPQPPAASG